MLYGVLFAALIGLAAASEPSSVDFSKNGKIVFGKSVVFGGAQENDINAVSSAEFLRNFKKVNNETDLEALPSDNESVPAGDMDRSDSGPRVLRGAYSDHNSGHGHDFPLFQPFKHNTIDTADFSDCALQGEWKPIGVPSEHYTQHAENHQREHFHTLTEEPSPHQSVATPNTHSPLDAEGVAFWNQLVKETNNNLHFMHHDKFPKRPNHHPHHHKKHPHKQRPPPPRHFYGNQHRPPPPPSPPPQSPFDNMDIFEDLRNPNGDASLFTIHQKPLITDDALLQQTLVVPQQQDLGGHDLGIITGTDHDLGAFPPLDIPLNHQNSPVSAAQVNANHGKYQDESYLSPPPVPPQNFHSPPDRPPDRPPRPQHRPKYIHRPNKPPPPPPPKFFKGDPRRPHHPGNVGPYEVSEHSEEHRGGTFAHVNTDPSTFTCGHEHSEGTNYHTASYQVEGEADPALLEDEITGTNNHLAPIIVGQPIFEHGGPTAPFNTHQFSKNEEHGHLGDLEEEGTETGEDSEAEGSEKIRVRPFPDKLVTSSRVPESSTQSSALETTAPQTFRPDLIPKDGFISKDSHSSATSSFHADFDHSAFADVGVHHSNHRPTFESSSKEFTFGHDPDFQKFQDRPPHHSFSGPNFSSPFGPKFPGVVHGSPKLHGPATSFTEFSFPGGPPRPNQDGIAVFDHTPQNETRPPKQPPRKKRPHKPYEVSENSGEIIPLSAFFPPKKMPKQFDMRMPNFANPNGRPRPAPPGIKPPQVPKNLKSTVHYDGNNLGVLTTHPRNKVTKIRLKMKGRPNGPPRFSEPDFRKGVTLTSRSH